MTAKEVSEEFKTSPLATKVIGGLVGIIVCIFGWWCVRVTNQLDLVLKSTSANEKLAETVAGHTQYLQQLYQDQSKIDKELSNQTIAVTGLVKDMDIVKDKLFR